MPAGPPPTMQHLACRVRRAEGPVEVTVSMDWAMPSPQPSLVPGFFEKFVSLASRPRDLNSTDIDWFVGVSLHEQLCPGQNAVKRIEIYAKTLIFFRTSRPYSIDFGRFVPMFR